VGAGKPMQDQLKEPDSNSAWGVPWEGVAGDQGRRARQAGQTAPPARQRGSSPATAPADQIDKTLLAQQASNFARLRTQLASRPATQREAYAQTQAVNMPPMGRLSRVVITVNQFSGEVLEVLRHRAAKVSAARKANEASQVKPAADR
ncbi:unnamed protein product, partial [marine sediment metagenome]